MQEHIQHLAEIIVIYRDEKCKLKLIKCNAAQEKINFTEYEIKMKNSPPNNINVETNKKL